MEPFRWRNSFNPRSRNTLVHWGNGASHQDDVTNNNGLGYTDSLVDINEIARNENVWLLVHRVQSGDPILLMTGWAQEGSDDFLRLGLADLKL